MLKIEMFARFAFFVFPPFLKLTLLLSLTGCVAQEEIILPTKYERIAEANDYKQCVALATNRHFDDTTKPELIVRNSLAACSGVKNRMLTAYPEQWRENYFEKVDAQLYQREIDWIVEARTKKGFLFR
jgi:hypothetical protein